MQAYQTLWHTLQICSPFSSRLITSNFSFILIVFHQFFTCTALGDAELFLTHVCTKSQWRWRGNYMSCVLISQMKSIHARDLQRDSDVTFC